MDKFYGLSQNLTGKFEKAQLEDTKMKLEAKISSPNKEYDSYYHWYFRDLEQTDAI
jgi:hypothetical protein